MQIEYKKEDFLRFDREEQKEIMRSWFFENFEDPVHNCPYETREGGYVYIWGGPYEARDELESKFADLVDSKLIDELVEELNNESFVWSGKPEQDEMDSYFIESITGDTRFYNSFIQNISITDELLTVEVRSEIENSYYKLLYASIITYMETYLSDAFIATLFRDKKFMRQFVENNPDFLQRKLTLSEIYKRSDGLEDEIKKYLIDIIWHNLAKIKQMYKKTFNIDFPDELGELYGAVITRHDIVHRNGRTLEGQKVIINKNKIEQLIIRTKNMIDFIDRQIVALETTPISEF